MSIELTEALQQVLVTILLSVITAALPVITYQVVSFIKNQALRIKASLNSDVLYTLETGARIVVAAIEQESVKGTLDKTKVELKEEAVSRLTTWLFELGLGEVNKGVLSDAIESALRQGFHNALHSEGEASIQILHE